MVIRSIGQRPDDQTTETANLYRSMNFLDQKMLLIDIFSRVI